MTNTATTFKPAPPAPKQDVRDQYVGRHAFIRYGDLSVPVVILDVRNRFGNLDARIEPDGGWGTTWVLASRLKVSARG